jgi:hypothetical protein
LNNQIAAELGVTDTTVRAAHRLGHVKRQAYSLTDVGESGGTTEAFRSRPVAATRRPTDTMVS